MLSFLLELETLMSPEYRVQVRVLAENIRTSVTRETEIVTHTFCYSFNLLQVVVLSPPAQGSI